MPRMPRILVTNDDGIYSEGLRKLAKALEPLGEIVIVAPDREQSAASHALTLNRPLRLLQIEENEWIVDGTPTDCVNLAILKLFKEQRPDLIVSGINFGPNLGDDVTYSGTISAAFEGALLNIPSIALSALVGAHFSFNRCAAFAAELTRVALEQHRDPRIILNVNFPNAEFEGVRITKLGQRIYSEGIIERLDPRGRKYYWIGGEPPVWHPGEGTDFEAVQQGFVSITPLHLDLTHHASIPRLKPLEELLGQHAAKG
ncbi:MAG: 5'/3'-nucleotidase SurE [Acidobacteria bacterium]|nr:5'/3'-nucleotidase SurE [Acidobacteriota bacterium]MBV9476456.1 5'/3'-nucleotidase SurE [Acidobacteriota bacterium]